ncbi:T9SS type A sorting domain-containing protein [Hymenobacter sp. 5317J-9]|uniref:T9SS type A sorting domain-containing protein n=1 Tax=Hymenobacter sp. 5317J-9 TaxID=2932250 RepID=UPI001FD6CE61|nr:T9SS type A sorting domain-containing protein [Hymenobacter sp. 5317J-9]UOQ99855.1 T9SS type A sorting domain-containing protein [Hymenobacter sp. 5317J-9]
MEAFLTGGQVSGVTNTGSGQSTDGADVLQVFAWDGAKPSFGWNFSGTQTGAQPLEAVLRGLTVKDPDIVSFCDGKFYMAAVYLATIGGIDRVVYEVQAYDPGVNGWVVVIAPTLVDNGSGLSCSSPNLDVDRKNGNAVITFAEGEVYVRALNIPAQTLYPISRVTFSSPGQQSSRQPDVAIFEDQASPGSSVVSVISVSEYTPSGPGGFVSLTLGQGKLADVQAGGTTPAIYYAGGSALYPLTDKLDWPRIAAPSAIYGRLDPADCLIVVRHNDNIGGGDEIHTLAKFSAASSSLIDHVISAPLLARTKGSQLPAVTYIGDGGFVAWQYDDSSNRLLNKNLDVVGTWVNWDGSSNLSGGNLQVANTQTFGAQFAPSVEGRNGATVYDGVLAWHDAAKADLAYKPLHWSTPQLRPARSSASAPLTPQDAEMTNGVGVYPNPAAAEATALVQLGATELAETVQVLDSRTGRQVATLPVAGLRDGVNRLSLPALPAGLYLLRVQTSQGVRVARFSYLP